MMPNLIFHFLSRVSRSLGRRALQLRRHKCRLGLHLRRKLRAPPKNETPKPYRHIQMLAQTLHLQRITFTRAGTAFLAASRRSLKRIV